MNAGIAFISRKSRKADVAWRYAIALGRWRGGSALCSTSVPSLADGATATNTGV